MKVVEQDRKGWDAESSKEVGRARRAMEDARKGRRAVSASLLKPASVWCRDLDDSRVGERGR